MEYRYYTADVFTDELFGGNQLAVFPDASGMSEGQMMSITREFNFSETVFVLAPANQAHAKRLRIFTPGRELPFAGHPTVGTAYVLAVTGEIPFEGGEERIVFEEGVGPVTVLIRGNAGSPTFTQLTTAQLPELQPSPVSAAQLAGLLGLENAAVLNHALRPEIYSCGVPFLIVPLRDMAALAAARIRANVWDSISERTDIPEIYLVTQKGWDNSESAGHVTVGDVSARMFAPGLGITEDPATGSAAASLAGFLSAQMTPGDSALHWTISQGVEMGRPSRIELTAERVAGKISAVHVGGQSLLVTSGTLHLPNSRHT